MALSHPCSEGLPGCLLPQEELCRFTERISDSSRGGDLGVEAVAANT